MEDSYNKNWFFLLVPIVFALFYVITDKNPSFFGAILAFLFGAPFIIGFFLRKGKIPYIIFKHSIIIVFIISMMFINEFSENGLLGVQSSGICGEGTWCWGLSILALPIILILVLIDVIIMIVQIVKGIKSREIEKKKGIIVISIVILILLFLLFIPFFARLRY